ncbi:MAG: glycosyltransferase family 39 protein [Thermoguttaceae bacterium]
MILIAGLVFFVNLGGPRLWDRDEPRNAGCAVEMMERGNWTVPMFNAELRVHKPILLYWFMMTAYAVFGVNEFAARIWSAIFGLGTVLVTYHIGRRLFSAQIGFWAAIILSSCMMFPVAARAATPDSVLIFFTTLATLAYVCGAFPSRHRSEPPSTFSVAESTTTYFPKSWPTVALMYALMGVATLAKGPVGFILPTAVIGMFLLIVRLPVGAASRCPPEDAFVGWLHRLLRPFAVRHFLAVCWSMRPITALGASLAVALPWYLWVGVRTHGEWPTGFFLVHHLQRAFEPMEGHDGPFFYYVIAVVASFFPWSLLLVPTIENTTDAIHRRAVSRPQHIFIACWAAVYVVVFSLARTKLPNYITPALPALALMTACYVERWSQQGQNAPQYWFRFAFSGLILVGIAVGIGVFAASWWFFSGDGWLGAIGLIPLIAGVAGRRILVRCQPSKAVVTFAITAIVFACALFGGVSVRVAHHQQCDSLFQAVYARTSQPILAAYGCFEPSWVFYARRPIESLPDDEPDEPIDFLREGDNHFLITTDVEWEAIRPLLPENAVVLTSTPYFMRQEKLLVIGCLSENETARNCSPGEGPPR